MKNFPTVPELSEELIEVFSKFPNQIIGWKKFFEKLNFKVVSLDEDYETFGNDISSSFIYGGNNDNNTIIGYLTPSDAAEENLIICGACFVSSPQIIENKFWPDTLDDTPHYLEIGFGLNGKAFMVMRGNIGEPLFKLGNYFSEPYERVDGTWIEIAGKLISLTKEITEAMKLVDPPQN